MTSPGTTPGGVATVSEIQLLTWADVDLRQRGTRGTAVIVGQVHARVPVTATVCALDHPHVSKTNGWIVPVYELGSCNPKYR